VSVLIDTTPLSNFAAVDRLDLVREVLGRAYVAEAVHQELQEGIALGYEFLDRIRPHVSTTEEEGWLQVVGFQDDAERELYRSLPSRLHDGERMSLALARCRGWLFFTDDLAARRAATRLGVEVSGTLASCS
jgi:predicted nucleic acid-binding protein